MNDESIGWVYILKNPRFDDLKVGFTTYINPQQRADELSKGTGVPAKYEVLYAVLLPHAYRVEQKVHLKLRSFRVSNNREFFCCNISEAMEAIHNVAGKTIITEIDNRPESIKTKEREAKRREEEERRNLERAEQQRKRKLEEQRRRIEAQRVAIQKELEAQEKRKVSFLQQKEGLVKEKKENNKEFSRLIKRYKLYKKIVDFFENFFGFVALIILAAIVIALIIPFAQKHDYGGWDVAFMIGIAVVATMLLIGLIQVCLGTFFGYVSGYYSLCEQIVAFSERIEKEAEEELKLSSFRDLKF